ncbi:trypsin-like peptidase domain-containing protein [Treponema zuelzerae]|uniref:Trypsin-like peptidase domain-containing protein n=1 Tax=Teretinema zuelzerae TaxID=156 RepID=A0AAE3EH88_9SPIR|nr:trypsin-like peptidase domain-containing protein [Teretinema zuelzerae]MBN2811910.1 trypsin-like peptidase domain-containing protein [Spirochaetales bacterium]MCD1653721.1 trypsin-like peptidase domain-containing protein [Teretinema zuelzerae]
MRLYSKNQVIGIVLVAAALASGFTLLISSRDSDTAAVNSEASLETPELVLQTGTMYGNDEFALSTLDVASSDGYTQDEQQNISVYERANEAVVNITTETVGINWFLEPVPQEGGSGSGSIIDTRGYVVTNTHVIANAVKIFISLSDGSQFEGTVVGTDKENDIAVLKFDPPKNRDLSTIPFGNSSNLKVGQKVLAIGNPFGFERTLTTGIVSALGRPIKTASNTIIKDMIQTDTAINPGNSGGPLLDTQGRMIGINTMIYSTSGSSAGIGFSIPVNTAKRVVSELIQFGKVRRGSIDAELVQLNSSIANYARLSTNNGLLVSRVGAGSNAEKAGLKGGTEAVRYGAGRSSSIIYLGGDVITGIGKDKIDTLTDYYSALESRKPGETVEVTVLRGRNQLTLKMVLAERQ